MTSLDPRIEEDVRKKLEVALGNKTALSKPAIDASLAAFRDRFGPDRFQSLSPVELLQIIHSQGDKSGLVYWLEFKNDEEFPGRRFGSISGGSSHKYGIFRRKDTQQWVKGSPQKEETISEAEAIAITRRHFDQLLAGIDLLEKLPLGADDKAYELLQDQLAERAPDISGVAWAHKYWSLLFPEKLDDYHNHDFQRYHLIKLLQLPPERRGLYVAAGRYARLSAELGWPMQNLGAALNQRDGPPSTYWAVATNQSYSGNLWNAMRDGKFIAMGPSTLGDLSEFIGNEEVRLPIQKRLEAQSPADPKNAARQAKDLRNLIKRAEEQNIVVALDGRRVQGVGRITGEYRFDRDAQPLVPHRRPVRWISTDAWDLPMVDDGPGAFRELGKHEENLVEIEKRLLQTPSIAPPITPQQPPEKRPPLPIALDGIPGRIQTALDRKGQVILYGPPGTGKTYWARSAALDLAAIASFGRRFSDLSDPQKAEIRGTHSAPGLVSVCTFHPAYGYEDFIEGFRPLNSDSGQLVFELRDGIFKRICADARRAPQRKFILMIDEINRGDIPRIFGELLTLLELDKREQALSLSVSGESFNVPRNVCVIGTMNTADRSIALLDTALRRRFGFIELMPDYEILGTTSIGGRLPLGPWLSALNDRIREHLGHDGRNLQIGHAYFLDGGRPVASASHFARILFDDIVPLLQEYCYENFSLMEKILGKDLVDLATQRMKKHLFDPGELDALLVALLEPTPDILTLTTARDALAVSGDVDEDDAKGSET